MPVKKIAVGTDGSEGALSAAAWAAHLGKQVDAVIVLLHVFTIDPANLPGGYVALPEAERDALRERYRSHLQGVWAAPCTDAGVQYETAIVDGHDVARTLIRAAQEKHCDLIVVGRRGLSGLGEMLLGSVSYHIIHLSPIPVTVVPR